MLRTLLIAALSAAAFGSAQAATIDLTDGNYTWVTDSLQPGVPLVFEETAGGVDFTFSAPDAFAGYDRFSSFNNGTTGIQLGGGGNSTFKFLFRASSDVSLTGFTSSQNPALTAPLLDVAYDGGTSIGNLLDGAAGTSSFVDGPLSILAGVDYLFQTSNTGVLTVGYLDSIDFSSAAISTVPVPAALPLMLSGLAGLGLVGLRRRRQGSASVC